MKSIALTVLLAACGHGYSRQLTPEPPSTPARMTWLGRDVRAFTSMGEPMFAVEGRLWMWRDGGWMTWDATRWRFARAPASLELARLKRSELAAP